MKHFIELLLDNFDFFSIFIKKLRLFKSPILIEDYIKLFVVKKIYFCLIFVLSIYL